MRIKELIMCTMQLKELQLLDKFSFPVQLEMCNEQQMGDHSNISSLETPLILA